jgi:O-acetyl-ADP-ribose deacetylase (regulator of RNase III)
MTRINLINGDIVDVKAQVLITAINPTGWWDGAIDNVIMKAAGGMFHGQAQQELPLHDGQLIYARQTGPHQGAFDDVLFVVDNLKIKAYSVVTNVLRAAAYREIKTVSLTPLRTGNMADKAEPRSEALSMFALAVRDFVDDETLSLDEINVVVYHNSKDYEYLLHVLNPA